MPVSADSRYQTVSTVLYKRQVAEIERKRAAMQRQLGGRVTISEAHRALLEIGIAADADAPSSTIETSSKDTEAA